VSTTVVAIVIALVGVVGVLGVSCAFYAVGRAEERDRAAGGAPEAPVADPPAPDPPAPAPRPPARHDEHAGHHAPGTLARRRSRRPPPRRPG
jgi:hypothetical protein